MRVLIVVLAAAVLSMGQRCPTDPSPPPCAPAAGQPTQGDVAAAYRDGHADGQDACPAEPEPEPCPACDVTVNDDEVADQAVHEFVRLVLVECSFGPSVLAAGNIDREVKRRIQNLHQYGRCH